MFKQSALRNAATSATSQPSREEVRPEPLFPKIYVLIALILVVSIIGVVAIAANLPVSPQVTFALWTVAILTGIVVSGLFLLISKQNTFRLIQGTNILIETCRGTLSSELDHVVAETFNRTMKVIEYNSEQTMKAIAEAHKSIKEELAEKK